MARFKKYTKFLLHISYATFLNYLINLSSRKVVSITKIDRFLPDLKHILIWTHIHGINEEGQSHLIKRKCPVVNCYFTKNRNLFGDVRYFDAIIFNLQDVSYSDYDLPKARTLNQKYVFAANDSADNYPVCSSVYDNFFNWTWSYKFESQILNRFLSIYNMAGEELGTHFRWTRNMKLLTSFQRNQLLSKSKAAAIFLNECESRSQREVFLKNLQYHLSKFNLTVDVYGECGPLKCKKKTMVPCFYRLKKNYFFYLALEDSFSEDYFTDLVLHGYNNNAVPIVYGGADYDKFLPPDSYINAMQYTEETLAMKMHYIISKQDIYSEFFKWKNYYVIKKSRVLEACDLCEMMNKPSSLVHRMSYVMFRKWWNVDYHRRCAENSFFTL